VTAADPRAAVEAVFRIESAPLIGGVTRTVGDIGLAEELAQDALVDALQQWPVEGTPRNPGAWLMTVAKRKAIDRFRRDRALAEKYARVGVDESTLELDDETRDGGPMGDDRLRLMFVACHPVLSVQARVAMTLRVIGGLTTAEIARAYLQTEPTIAQRIVRAKKTIADAGVKFEVPVGDELAIRLDSVLQVIYVIFNEGYSATAGQDWLRADLCGEALRLGRLLAALAPDQAEAHGLVSLMEIQSSRLGARVGADGAPILLLDQDRRQWDPLLIRRGLAALDRAFALAPTPGPYALQAAIAACHARAIRAADTDWAEVARLYGVLAETMPSPIVDLNRAVALSMAHGPQAGLDLVEQLLDAQLLGGYHLLHSVRGDLLDRLDRHDEAAAEFDLAHDLAQNEAERRLSATRAAASRARKTSQLEGVGQSEELEHATDGGRSRDDAHRPDPPGQHQHLDA
jgi:RNA polymerase sigma factor (sigma-70 family)